MQEHLISIIVPCYNQSQYLPDALQSVLDQTYQNWQCIIVNDGSPDNTEDVALEWCKRDKRFVYLKKENGGLSSARNAGIRLADGTYILPLDADDMIGANYLEKCLREFKKNKLVCLVYSEARKFDYVDEKWELEPYSFDRLMTLNMIYCSAIYRKADWKEIGGYDESILNGLEDWEFWLRLIKVDSKVVQIPEELFFYRIKENSMFKQMRQEDIDYVLWKVVERHFDLYKANFAPPQRLFLENKILLQKNEKLKKYKNCKIKEVFNRIKKIIISRCEISHNNSSI